MKIFEKQVIIAHRGAKGLVRFENSIEAFAKAIEVEADIIEIDLRKTKEGKIVVFHDPSIKGKSLKELTHQELNELAGFNIPTLVETLEFIKGKILLDIELKESGYVEEVLDLVFKHLNIDEFLIRSFNDIDLIETKKYNKNIKTSLLLGRDVKTKVFRTRMSELFPRRRLKKTKADFVSPHYRLLKFGFLRRMRCRKMQVVPWTVNDESLMAELLTKKKVDGIVTDFPDLAKKYV